MRVDVAGESDVKWVKEASRKAGLDPRGKLVLVLTDGKAKGLSIIDYQTMPPRAEVTPEGRDRFERLIAASLEDAAARGFRSLSFVVPETRMELGEVFREFGAVAKTEKPDKLLFTVDCTDYHV